MSITGCGGAVPGDLPAVTAAMRRQFDQVRQRTRGLLTALPPNRALLKAAAPAESPEKAIHAMTSHVALDSNAHRDLRIRAGASAELGDEVMACLTVPSEFRRVQNEFPILFRRDLDSGRFSALALFGFENGENLFLEDGRWDARYRPLALSIQPFLIGRAEGRRRRPKFTSTSRTSASPDAGEEGLRAFDEDGRPTPYLESIMGGLDELDQGYRSSADFFAALERYELLEPFSFDVELARRIEPPAGRLSFDRRGEASRA